MNFSEIKNTFFFEPKNDGNLILTDYWKVFVLNFLEMGNTFFFGDKKLVERWYLLITEKFLFWTFREWEIRSFLRQKLIEKWYLLITEKSLFWATKMPLFWTFRWWEIRSFFTQKSDVKIIFTWSFWAFHDIPGTGKYVQCKINQSFGGNYKINESDAKVSTHYWVVWLDCKCVWVYVFITNKFFSFFRNMVNSKTVKK